MGKLTQTWLVHQGNIPGEIVGLNDDTWYVTNYAYPDSPYDHSQYINSTRSFNTEKEAREFAAKKNAEAKKQ